MKDVKQAIKAQLAVVDEIKSDFITLTTGEGKRILKLLEEKDHEIENLKQTAQNMMEGIVVSQPKIVRCKDCKHRDPEDGKCDSGHAIRWNLSRPDYWFCADGERKET